MHTNVTRRIDNFLQTFLEKASHQTSLTLPHLCSVACVQGARGGGASYACLTLHSLSLLFLFNQTLNNLFLRYSNRQKKINLMIHPSTIKINIEGGWRGGDRYPVATAIDRLLDFPREREGGGRRRKGGGVGLKRKVVGPTKDECIVERGASTAFLPMWMFGGTYCYYPKIVRFDLTC